jgi:hypothetical protein
MSGVVPIPQPLKAPLKYVTPKIPKSRKNNREITSTFNIPGIELIIDLTATYQFRKVFFTFNPSFLEIILSGLRIRSILKTLIKLKSIPVRNNETS